MIIPKLRSPIVLVHGLFGFNKLELGGATFVNYFPGIPELLIHHGNRVLVPTMTPTGSVGDLARQLKAFLINYSPGEPVHLVAHSMGGLDARFMISRLDMADMVLTLTTLGTPHRGTSFADWGIKRFERIAKPLLETIGLPYEAFYDLTRARCKTFNENTPDAANVRYFSIAGRHDGNFLQLEWLLPFGIVTKDEGDNDGIVAVTSASYGEHVDTWEGDHLGLINWYHPVKHYRGVLHDPKLRYGSILRRLADLGY